MNLPLHSKKKSITKNSNSAKNIISKLQDKNITKIDREATKIQETQNPRVSNFKPQAKEY